MRAAFLVLGVVLVVGIGLVLMMTRNESPASVIDPSESEQSLVASERTATQKTTEPESPDVQPTAQETQTATTGEATAETPPPAPSSIFDVVSPVVLERVYAADFSRQLDQFFARLDEFPDQATADRVTVVLLDNYLRRMASIETVDREAGDLKDPTQRRAWAKRREQVVNKLMNERREALRPHFSAEELKQVCGEPTKGGDVKEGF